MGTEGVAKEDHKKGQQIYYSDEYLDLLILSVIAPNGIVICGFFSQIMEICDTHSPMANLSQFLKPEELPKYFGIDVDGTLYTKNVEGFERNVKAITQIRKRGYIPFICTGKDISMRKCIQGGSLVKWMLMCQVFRTNRSHKYPQVTGKRLVE